ncbi:MULTISPECIES: hypothetical protein [unclassified Leptospira]|uniref:hypothetical protein n=1 Tax=unclassified Leptospira TaxID=2633828 RepID=UPI0012F68EDD|nr:MULTISPECIES: hypothetical protein [unclassified Leptospira]MCR1795598.1 hypothetical protein [Leptospira sp. id769339]
MKLLYFLSLSFSLFACSSNRIDKKLLVTTAWGQDIITGEGWVLEFKEDQTYTEYYAGEGCGGYSGSFEIKSNQVFLEPEKNPGCTPENKPVKSKKCILEKTDQSLYYTQRLNCGENSFFWNYSSELGSGENRKYKGIEIVTVGQINSQTTANVKFRENPNQNSLSFKCSYIDEDHQQMESEYIPTGKDIVIIGRQTQKVRIGQWENYWYLIAVSSNAYNGCYSDVGWVFGQFINPQ